MNKKDAKRAALIKERAAKLLEAWNRIEEDRYHAEHENWHEVNVKRSGDYLDRDDLLEMARELSPRDEVITHKLAEDIEERSQSLYDYFLSDAWEQLNYEISDIAAITEGDKDERKAFKHLRTSYNWAKGKSILSLGRSGGHACFQMDPDNLADEIRDDLEYLEDLDLADISEKLDTLAETIEEIEFIKQYVERFNKNLSWKDEVKFRMEEKLEEIIEDEKDTAERKKDKSIMQRTLAELLEDGDETISRHATGILKASKKGDK